MANLKPKTPKWREEWTRLVGDNKYLVIRNWDEYQVLTPSGFPARWIKDYVNADFDTPLSFFETGVLDRLRRFRGRLGNNIPSDLELILSGTAAMGKDRHCVPGALCKLVVSGRLVPSNHADAVSKKSEVKRSKEESSSTSEIPTSQDTDFIPSEVQVPKPASCSACGATVTKGWRKKTCPRCKQPLGKSQRVPVDPAAEPPVIPPAAPITSQDFEETDSGNRDSLSAELTRVTSGFDACFTSKPPVPQASPSVRSHGPWLNSSNRAIADPIKAGISTWCKACGCPFTLRDSRECVADDAVEMPKSEAFQIEED